MKKGGVEERKTTLQGEGGRHTQRDTERERETHTHTERERERERELSTQYIKTENGDFAESNHTGLQPE